MVSGSRAFGGAFETEGLEGCCGDSVANRRFVELAPQHVRRRAREPNTHHTRPGSVHAHSSRRGSVLMQLKK